MTADDVAAIVEDRYTSLFGDGRDVSIGELSADRIRVVEAEVRETVPVDAWRAYMTVNGRGARRAANGNTTLAGTSRRRRRELARIDVR